MDGVDSAGNAFTYRIYATVSGILTGSWPLIVSNTTDGGGECHWKIESNACGYKVTGVQSVKTLLISVRS